MNKFSGKAMFSYNEKDHTEEISNCKYKMCYSDHDTPLHSAAISLQESYIIVKHKASGREKEFKNITEFKGRGSKSIGGWLGETNESRIERGLTEFSLDDFEITDKVRINPHFKTVEEALEYGLESIGYSVGTIKKYSDSEDYRLVVSGGNGNYRDDFSKTLKYKGQRSDKPILYSELKEKFLEQYKSKIILSDFNEAEDVLGIKAEEHRKLKGDNFEDWEICIQFIDKDVKNVYAPSFCYRKVEDGFRLPTQKECTFELVSQVIAGDPTDNIRGLPTLTEEVTTKFGLRKANGCGKTTGENLIKACETEKEMWERAAFAYQSYYGMEPVKFKSWDGEELEWTWLDFMQETAVLVKMQEYEGHIINVGAILDGFEIDYSKKLFPSPKKVFRSDVEEEVVGVNESLLQLLSTQLNSYKSLKKSDLVDKLDDIKDCLTDITSNFDEAFYEMKQEEK